MNHGRLPRAVALCVGADGEVKVERPVDEPDFRMQPVGASAIGRNSREWLDADRGQVLHPSEKIRAYRRLMNDSREQYRRIIDALVHECREGQGPVAAQSGNAQAAFEAGVFNALRVLYERSVPPFDDSYEGTPFNDFVGRLNGWTWPSD